MRRVTAATGDGPAARVGADIRAKIVRVAGMSWFSRARERPDVEAGAPQSHRSLALKPLLAGLDPETRHSVLDLGPPVGQNLELLSARGCRIRITDLFRSLSAETLESREAEACGSLFARLLPFDASERFDIVLLWDLLDYLRPHEIAGLMGRVTPACAPRAIVFALVSTLRQIPATPRRYRIEDAETLSWNASAEVLRPCPRHTQAELIRWMRGFAVKSSFILRNGVQEYLLERKQEP